MRVMVENRVMMRKRMMATVEGVQLAGTPECSPKLQRSFLH